jgi:tryptophanyl-tRNA synthetase
MRPTGKLHLGHFVGALANWVKMQDEYQCYYMVADWHALMSEYESPGQMRENSIEMVKDFIAAGLDPEKSVIFVQSQVPEHLELHMVFSDITPLGWVERCPTYKEQLREIVGRDLTTYGFLGYPVLQAADIALYRASAVPVGVDQVPHLELTREIIRRFNSLYKSEVFPEPEPLLTGASKLLGIDNRKMSKSYGNAINISDSPAEIEKKVGQMITDPERIKLKDRGHPDICNVFSYYCTFSAPEAQTDPSPAAPDGRASQRYAQTDPSPAAPDGRASQRYAPAEVKRWCEGATVGCTECKKRLAKVIADNLETVRKKREALTDARVAEILSDGARRARAEASRTMAEVKKLINFV